MFSVVKRNGESADFNITKISDAIMKAFNACEKQYTNDMIDMLSLRVTADFQHKMNGILAKKIIVREDFFG